MVEFVNEGAPLFFVVFGYCSYVTMIWIFAPLFYCSEMLWLWTFVDRNESLPMKPHFRWCFFHTFSGDTFSLIITKNASLFLVHFLLSEEMQIRKTNWTGVFVNINVVILTKMETENKPNTIKLCCKFPLLLKIIKNWTLNLTRPHKKCLSILSLFLHWVEMQMRKTNWSGVFVNSNVVILTKMETENKPNTIKLYCKFPLLLKFIKKWTLSLIQPYKTDL